MRKEEKVEKALIRAFQTLNSADPEVFFKEGIKWADEHPNPWVKIKDKYPKLQNSESIIKGIVEPNFYVVFPCLYNAPFVATAVKSTEGGYWNAKDNRGLPINENDWYFPIPSLPKD